MRPGQRVDVELGVRNPSPYNSATDLVLDESYPAGFQVLVDSLTGTELPPHSSGVIVGTFAPRSSGVFRIDLTVRYINRTTGEPGQPVALSCATHVSAIDDFVVVAVGDKGLLRISLNGGQQWSSHDLAATENLRAVAWNQLASRPRFVAVGASNGQAIAYYSTDPATGFTSAAIAAPAAANAVVWSVDWSEFVVVGDGGLIAKSRDGQAWDVISSGTEADLFGIVWAGNAYIAVGAEGTVLTSGDGWEWESSNTEIPARLTGIAWSPGIGFVASTDQPRTVAFSKDAVDWMAITHSGLPASSRSVAVSATAATPVFVVVGTNGGFASSTDPLREWTARPVPRVASITVCDVVPSAVLGGFLAASDGCWTLRGDAHGSDWHAQRIAREFRDYRTVNGICDGVA